MFQNVMKYAKSHKFPLTEKQSVVDVYEYGIRKVTESNGTSKFEKKTRIQEIFRKEYNFKISINIEEDVEENKVKLSDPILIRNRHRYSFNLGHSLLELTIIDDEIYEIELEIVNNGDKSIANNFILTVFDIWKIIYGSPMLYTNSDKSKMSTEMLKYTKSENRYKNLLSERYLVNAINIQKHNLYYKSDTCIINEHASYVASVKADGVRKMLLIASNGIWLIKPNTEFALLSKSVNSKYIGTILDGELITYSDESNESHGSQGSQEYLAFDILSYPESRNIQSIDYTKRLELTKSLLPLFKNKYVKVSFKSAYPINRDNFYEIVNKLLDTDNRFKVDGLMFTPIKGRTILYDNKIPEFPTPIYKWKPPKMLTIDFYVENNELYLVNRGEYYKFEGTKQYPFDYSHLSDISNIQNGSVVEFEYYNNKMTPIRIRTDKLYPNSVKTGINNWNDIMNPFLETTIRGKDLVMVFYYFNRIKDSLFDASIINNKTESTNNNTLLDIGGGRGGDIAKWMRNYDTVITVEPNSDNYSELIERVKNMGNIRLIDHENNIIIDSENFNLTIYLLPFIGQDSKLIRDCITSFGIDKVDTVSLMLSMTFFWENQENVNALRKTITDNLKPNGKFIFLTMDGDQVKKEFKDNSRMKFYDASIELLKNDKVKVILPNTIVDVQYEYLVFLKQLDLKLIEYNVADDNPLLTKTSLKFSKLYTFGHFINTDDVDSSTTSNNADSSTTNANTNNVSSSKIIKIFNNGNLSQLLNTVLDVPDKSPLDEQIDLTDLKIYHDKYKVNMIIVNKNYNVKYKFINKKYIDYIIILEESLGYYSLIGINENDEQYAIFVKDDPIIKELLV
jgi:SAM-dependent methyltransferase